MRRRIFISSSIEDEKLPFFCSDEIEYGKAHYSWKIITKLYSKGLFEAGLEIHKVDRPEIYQTKIALETFGVRHDDIHLAVKPIEHIRPFYGLKNIFIAGWEFPEFSNIAHQGNPLFNQINILQHANDIWCWSHFTVKNLKAYGIDTAIAMPPPVIIPKTFVETSILITELPTLALNTTRIPIPDDQLRLGNVLENFKGSRIFFSVLNPFDNRKQIKSMLTAFEIALTKTSNLLLIIKLVIDNVSTRVENIQEILSVHYGFDGQNERIIFIGETLTEGQMTQLMQTAHFYLCTSSTEGLNLPLIEAMSQGIVPVSSKASAMSDYINEKNSIVIEHDISLTIGAYHFLHNDMPTTHFPPRLSSIVDSIIYASSLNGNRYSALSNKAKEDVFEKYSLDSFVTRFKLTPYGDKNE